VFYLYDFAFIAPDASSPGVADATLLPMDPSGACCVCGGGNWTATDEPHGMGKNLSQY
jgi:hypothetical protein